MDIHESTDLPKCFATNKHYRFDVLMYMYIWHTFGISKGNVFVLSIACMCHMD